MEVRRFRNGLDAFISELRTVTSDFPRFRILAKS